MPDDESSIESFNRIEKYNQFGLYKALNDIENADQEYDIQYTYLQNKYNWLNVERNEEKRLRFETFLNKLDDTIVDKRLIVSDVIQTNYSYEGHCILDLDLYEIFNKLNLINLFLI